MLWRTLKEKLRGYPGPCGQMGAAGVGMAGPMGPPGPRGRHADETIEAYGLYLQEYTKLVGVKPIV